MSREAEHADEQILRDRLALDRTKLANERTFLAYLRTTIVLVLSGITVIKFFRKEAAMVVLACALLAAGFATGIVGTVRSLAIARRMRQWARQLDASLTSGPASDEPS